MYEWKELILESLYFLNRYLKTLGWLEVYIEWPILHEMHCLLFSLTKNVQGSSKHVKINISNCLADAPRYPRNHLILNKNYADTGMKHFILQKLMARDMDSTYRYILDYFFTCNNRCRYTLGWLNRIFCSSIPYRSRLRTIMEKIWMKVVNFHIKPGCMWGIEGETRTDILTKACKFSNFFIELACLGSDVCGQGDTIIASFLWGSACYESKKIKKPSRKLVPYSTYTGEKW